VDCLVVSLHWGQEYQARPSARQQRLGRAAIDAGADLVLGHHPHVAQPIETYRGKPIVYSLGNAIFDREGSARWSNGLVVRLELGRDRARVVDKKGIWTRAGRPVRR
ncbi:MAG TPA: capsular biosynthesis protein, partial [Armatimonadetes bacterium]|nr:capsular biosynthesis protein [Armatimonadota bacterium]